MLYKRISLSLLFLFLLFNGATAQSFIGSQSNYAGSNALRMNPASMTTSNLYFDVSLFQFGVMAYNDYAYLMSKDVMKMALTLGEYVPSYDVNGLKKDFLVYDQYGHRSRNLYESLDLNILNMMYDIDGRQAVGFSFNTRVYTNAKNIPWEIPVICINGTDDSTLYDRYQSKGAKVATMEWAEVALSYSNTIYERYNHKFDVGVTAKYLIGYSAAVANVNELDYNIIGDEDVNVNLIDMDVAYALPLNYDEPFTSDNLFNDDVQRGGGFATDLGFFYTRKSDSKTLRKSRGNYNISKVDYIWRVGASLMDVGFINFSDNALEHHFFADNNMRFDVDGLNNVKTMNELSSFISANYYNGDSTKSSVGNSFLVGLPTTLRVQFDYNMYRNFFVNATLIQPVRLFKYSVMAAPRVMVEPRYESEYFDFALPVSLYDYEFIHIGASFRLAYLTVGTENIANYLGLGKMRGMDLYVSLKFNLSKASKMANRRDACWTAF